VSARPSIDLAALKPSIGRVLSASDAVTAQLVRRLRATLDEVPGEPAAGDGAPLSIHWCLAPMAAPMSELGSDGLPERGGFLPPVALPRRMWAGGKLEWHDRLRVGDPIARRTEIADIALKEGRSGPLCFITLSHEISTARGLALRERQDLVFRDLEHDGAPPPAPLGLAPPAPQWQRTLRADPVLLFRYSALTFNSHRIHYDRRYCEKSEGYPGLLVHGPLQATLLIELAHSTRPETMPRRFEYRALRPLFDGAMFTVNALTAGDGLELWIADEAGQPTMKGRAAW
jgi:3-methylfumaryl-CoA hydratase